jgi:DNA-binding NarL/FixJ family response regulator
LQERQPGHPLFAVSGLHNSKATMPISISIVEDDKDTREHLLAFLSGDARLRCVSTYASGEAAVRVIANDQADVALVDINLPGMNGIECVARLKAQQPQMQVLMLTKYEESDLIFNSLRAGASGYLLKKNLTTELVPAIEQVLAGGAPMSMQIARKVVDHFHRIIRPASDVEKLTPREQEILRQLARGYSYKEISENLGISLNTVKTHLHAIYEKLHVQSRTEATIKFLKRD